MCYLRGRKTVMAKRKILAEFISGVEAMKKHREGKLTLWNYKGKQRPLCD
jgi:hypothetical protein